MDERVKKVKKEIGTIGQIPKKSKHIRWGYEPSKNFDIDYGLIYYHLAIVEDSDFDRKKIRDDIFSQLCQIDSRINQISEFELRVKNSRLKCLYVGFESIVAPKFLDLKKLNVPAKYDKEFKEKKVLKIEDYLKRIYE